ncbi:MAG: hypothetical protein ACLFQV_02440 [Vulcanimicrobiota bacterium]
MAPKVLCRGCKMPHLFIAVQEDVSNFQVDMSGEKEQQETKMVRLSCRCGTTTWVKKENFEKAKGFGQEFPA